MTPKQISRKLQALTVKQGILRDQMRELTQEVEEHFENAQEATESLEYAAEAVSRLL